MIKKLTKHGNSYALVIDKPILDLLGIDAETPLEVKTNGSGLWIEPVISDERRREIERIREKIHGKNGAVFKRLAE